MTTLIKAAGVEVEPIWTTLFARALEGIKLAAINPTDCYYKPYSWLVCLCRIGCFNFDTYLTGKDIGNLICNVGSGVAASGGGGAAAADGGAGEAKEEKKEEKKEESEEESDDDMGFGMWYYSILLYLMLSFILPCFVGLFD